MSKISSIYDELRVLIGDAVTAHTELNNPYTLTDEADLLFEKGWAIGMGPAENTNRTICNQFSIRRDVIITLTYQLFMTHRDIETRVTGEKALLEAHKSVINAIEQNKDSDNYENLRYNTDSGIEYIGGDQVNFLVLEILADVEYFETLT